MNEAIAFLSSISFKHHLIFCRDDGIVLYQNQEGFDHLAVLAAGAWKAAESMMDNKKSDNFSFNFATTDSGVYLLPIRKGNNSFFLITRYQQEVNPGMVKSMIKKIARDLEGKLGDQKEEELYMNNITDKEINELFLF